MMKGMYLCNSMHESHGEEVFFQGFCHEEEEAQEIETHSLQAFSATSLCVKERERE